MTAYYNYRFIHGSHATLRETPDTVKSLYDILEISPAASEEVIKAAYRVLCSRYHPDKNTGAASATRAMTAVNRAYAILSDPIRRKAYDAWLTTGSATARRARRAARTAEAPVRAIKPALNKTRAAATERAHLTLASSLSVLVAILVMVAMIYELSPSGPAAETTLNIFKESPDPGLLRLNKAEALLTGHGGPKNFLQAKAEFEAIANTKDQFDGKGYRGRAAQRLGEMYAAGLGVPKDTLKAEEWLRTAAEYGRVVGPAPALAVAQFFEEGTNGARDLVQAYRWYNLAAGIPFDLDKSTLTRDAYTRMITLAQKKREEFGATLTTEQLNSAQLSPLPPCRSPNC
jgi:curved DNA-binding protein CbpA